MSAEPMSQILTRRGLVRSAPAAVFAASLPALPALAAPRHPDAELVGCCARLAEAAARRNALFVEIDEALDSFDPPPTPEALLWRRDDHWYICPDPDRTLDSVEEIEGQPRYTYDTDGVAEKLAAKIARWKATANLLSGVDKAIVRAEEILAALKAYKAEEAQALAACGYTPVVQACKQQEALIVELARRIAATPAHTAEGVCVKARAALDASGRSVAAFEQVELTALLNRVDRLPRDDERLLLVSAMLDAATLGAPAPSSERRAA